MRTMFQRMCQHSMSTCMAGMSCCCMQRITESNNQKWKEHIIIVFKETREHEKISIHHSIAHGIAN